MPAVEGTLDADEEDTFQRVLAIAIFKMQARDVALHELTSVPSRSCSGGREGLHGH